MQQCWGMLLLMCDVKTVPPLRRGSGPGRQHGSAGLRGGEGRVEGRGASYTSVSSVFSPSVLFNGIGAGGPGLLPGPAVETKEMRRR